MTRRKLKRRLLKRRLLNRRLLMTRRTHNPKMTSFLKPRITLSAAPMVSLFPKDSATTQVSIMTTPRITLSSAPTASFLKMKGWSPMNAKVASVVMVPVFTAPTASFLKKKGCPPRHASVVIQILTLLDGGILAVLSQPMNG